MSEGRGEDKIGGYQKKLLQPGERDDEARYNGGKAKQPGEKPVRER